MATVTIAQLPATTTTSGTDDYVLVQNNVTKRITYTNLFASATGIPIIAGTTGTLSVARGGTGTTTATGTGNLVLATSPTLTTPTLGAATATSINNVVITPSISPATFTLSGGKTFQVTHSIVLSGGDGTTMTFPLTSATIARTDAGQTFDGAQKFNTAIVTGVQDLSGPGAVGVDTPTTAFTSTGTGNALTLADGVSGQLKTIIYVAEAAGADTGVLTPANFGNGTTITFNNVGDACTLQFISGNWWVVSLNGAAVA